jgi:hypothetical protein
MATKTRRNASLGDVAIGVGVLMAVIGALVWFFSLTRPDEPPLPDPVEYEAALAAAREAYPYPVLAPEPVPDGWRVTNVRMDDDQAGHRWRLGMFTDEGQFVGVEQSDGEIASYRDDRLEEFVADGSTTVAGEEWERLREPDGDHALVRESDGVLTIVRGTLDHAALEDVVAMLR